MTREALETRAAPEARIESDPLSPAAGLSGAEAPAAKVAPAAGTRPDLLGLGRRHLHRLLIVIAAGLIVDAAITHWTSGLSGLQALSGFSLPWLGLASLIALIPWAMNALRLTIWSDGFGRRIGPARALQIVWAAEVTAAATPTAVGGAPAKAALLAEDGIPPGAAIVLCGVGTVEDAAAFALLLPLGLARQVAAPEGLAGLPAYGAIEQALRGHSLVAGLLAALFAAVVGTAILLLVPWQHARVRRRGGVEESRAGSDPGPRARLRAWGREFRAEAAGAYRLIRAEGRFRFARTIPLALVQWVARYSVATLVVRAAGGTIEPFFGIALQWFVFTFMSITPTPGAIGGAEAAFLSLYAGLIPSEGMNAAMLSWRTLSFYAPVAIAAFGYLALESGLSIIRGARPLRRLPRLPGAAPPTGGCR